MARAVAKRRREFATVRACARRAMEKLGVPPRPILPGERGAPRWPDGVVGSMTHCDGYRAAALVRAGDLASLGIDAELHGPLPEGVLQPRRAAGRARTGCAGSPAERPDVHWDRLLFSAKESVYKAWFPLTGKWLDFMEADIDITADGTFHAALLVPGPWVGGRRLSHLDGRWTAGRADRDGDRAAARLTPSRTRAGVAVRPPGPTKGRGLPYACPRSAQPGLGVPHGRPRPPIRTGTAARAPPPSRSGQGAPGQGPGSGHQFPRRRKNPSSLPVSPARPRACSASASTAGGTSGRGRPRAVEGGAHGVQQPQIRLDGGAFTVGQYGGRHRSASPVGALGPAPCGAHAPHLAARGVQLAVHH